MSNIDETEILANPEKIAYQLFTNHPDSEKSYQLRIENNNADLVYIFQIFLTIMMEGFSILSNGLNNINHNKINIDHFLILNRWFKSLGYIIKVHVVDKNDETYSNYYCKIILKLGSYESFFDLKNIHKNYHFLLSSSAATMNPNILSDIYSIFIVEDKVFKVSFNRYFET